MSTRTAFMWGLGLSLSFAVSVSGCKWKHGEDGNCHGWEDDDDDDDDDDEGKCAEDGRDPAADEGESRPERPSVCDALCDRLVTCGTLARDARDACVATCDEKHASAPYMTEVGAVCVIEQACQPVDAYDCPGAPLPGTSAHEADGPSPAACEADCDCPSGDACVDGACATPCEAASDCAEGEACEAGHCSPSADPPVSCTANCDCPTGQVCTEGLCGWSPQEPG